MVSACPLATLPSVLMTFTIPSDATARDFVQQVRRLLFWRVRLLIEGTQAQTPQRRARGQCTYLIYAVHNLNDRISAVLDATTHLHEQLAALREHRSALQTALAQVYGARSTEPHPLLVSLGALDSDEEGDQEEDDPVDLDIRIGAFSLTESVDESLQFHGGSPSSLAQKQRTFTPMLHTGSSAVRRGISHLVLKCSCDHVPEPSPPRV
jgi:hypothetical protein